MRRAVLAALVVALALFPAAAAMADDCSPVPPVGGCPTRPPTPTSTPAASSSPTPTPRQADAQADTVALERQFFDLVNRERTRRGMRALSYNAALTDVARRHSARMASEGRLYHNTAELRSDDFARRTGYPTMVGENVGEGPSVRWLHDAFMNSPSHRSNIIESRYTALGVGVSVRDDTIWVTQDYIQERVPTKRTFPKAASSGTTPRITVPRVQPPRAATGASAAAQVAPVEPPKPKVSALRLPPIPAPIAAPVDDRRKPLLPLAVLATLSAVAFASRRDAGAWI